MNKFVTTALAVAAAGTLSHADPGDNDWLELDDEINSLASALTPAQDGMGWSALIRVYYDYSSDDVGTVDVSGVDTDCVMSNSFGFGGTNATLAFRRFES